MARKQKKTPEQAPVKENQKPGSEVAQDQARQEGGPRYHGAGWEQAAEDEERGRSDTADDRTELEAADEEIQDPGTRGAVFGREGKGIVERDEPDDPAGRSLAREQQKVGSRPD
jgi:hypothetical protein